MEYFLYYLLIGALFFNGVLIFLGWDYLRKEIERFGLVGCLVTACFYILLWPFISLLLFGFYFVVRHTRKK